MLKLILKTIIIIILLNNNEISTDQKINKNINNNYIEIIGKLEIKKLNINKPLYEIYNDKNNIEENIEILKESILPPNNKSIVFLAAHSGTSNISYFNELDKLEKKDIIELTINNKVYIYEVKDKYRQKKKGYININKEKENQLILTTCDPNNEKYQLIINSTIKEFN